MRRPWRMHRRRRACMPLDDVCVVTRTTACDHGLRCSYVYSAVSRAGSATGAHPCTFPTRSTFTGSFPSSYPKILKTLRRWRLRPSSRCRRGAVKVDAKSRGAALCGALLRPNSLCAGAGGVLNRLRSLPVYPYRPSARLEPWLWVERDPSRRFPRRSPT